LITLTTAAVGLLFTFVPGIKPSDPPERSATITQVTVEPARDHQVVPHADPAARLHRAALLPGDGGTGADPDAAPSTRSAASQEDCEGFLRMRCISVCAQIRIRGSEDVAKRLTINCLLSEEA
jgi:hypothetical protein